MALAVAGVAFGGLLGGGGDSGEGGLTETAAASGSGEAPAEGSTTVPEQLAATGEAADAQAAEEDEMEDGAATPALGRTDDSAMIVIEGDTIVLEGTMASQEAIDAFVASLDGVTQPIDNRIRVEAGAGTGANRVVIANDVFFEFGSSELGEVDQATLNSVISFCLARPDLILTVVGHTDSIGSAEANQALSLARAEEVMALLIAEGVPAELLRVRGDGETTPRATNDTEEGRAENRRIEFEFSPS